MADLSNVPSDSAYRPLAGLAVAGFVISCLFGGVVAVSALLALWQGAPIFFETWTVLIAVVGAIVSWWAQNDIRNSEGAKAGQTLARWGLWISLVTGAGYLAYSYFTGLALSQQAMEFFLSNGETPGFIATLKKGGKEKRELRRAFLLTLPAPAREGVRVDDEASLLQRFDKPASSGAIGDFSRFLQSPLVALLSHLGDHGAIEPVGVQTWKYEKRSYYVMCQFRLKTPEASTTFFLAARSSEGEAEGQSRQWFADVQSYRVDALDKSALGTGLAKARRQAVMYFRGIEDALHQGESLPNLAAVDGTDWTRFDVATRQETKSRVEAVLRGAVRNVSWQFLMPEPALTDWQRDAEGRISIALPIMLIFQAPEGKTEPFGVDGIVTVQSATRIDPHTYAESGSLIQPEWTVTRIEFTQRRAKPLI